MSKTTALTPVEKRQVARLYENDDLSQTELAQIYLVSRRTIQRALLELGVIHYNQKKPRMVTGEEEAILALVHRRGLNSMSLTNLLDGSGITRDNVARYLASQSPGQYHETLLLAKRVRSQLTQRKTAANE